MTRYNISFSRVLRKDTKGDAWNESQNMSKFKRMKYQIEEDKKAF
jgi:hypothetical protein